MTNEFRFYTCDDCECRTVSDPSVLFCSSCEARHNRMDDKTEGLLWAYHRLSSDFEMGMRVQHGTAAVLRKILLANGVDLETIPNGEGMYDRWLGGAPPQGVCPMADADCTGCVEGEEVSKNR